MLHIAGGIILAVFILSILPSADQIVAGIRALLGLAAFLVVFVGSAYLIHYLIGDYVVLGLIPLWAGIWWAAIRIKKRTNPRWREEKAAKLEWRQAHPTTREDWASFGKSMLLGIGCFVCVALGCALIVTFAPQ